MREILFRGQTRRYGEKVRMGDGMKLPSHWVYGGVLQGNGAHSIIYGGENVDDPSEGLYKWPVYTDTLGQCTDLTDKNGKRIFEGDVVTFAWDRGDDSCKFFIEYVDGEFCATPVQPTKDVWSIRVCGNAGRFIIIGNIHDNHELLRGDGNG